MTRLDMLKALCDISDSNTDDLLNVYLEIAEKRVLNRLYPFETESEIPPKYEHKVIEIAQYLYYRRGSEGEISHSENGVNRSYEDSDIPSSMLEEIVPMVGVL